MAGALQDAHDELIYDMQWAGDQAPAKWTAATRARDKSGGGGGGGEAGEVSRARARNVLALLTASEDGTAKAWSLVLGNPEYTTSLSPHTLAA